LLLGQGVRLAVGFRIVLVAGALAALCACASSPAQIGPYRAANLRPYDVNGRRYTPEIYSHYDAKGLASWYAYPTGARRTATGEWFDARQMTAAHKTLPLPCVAEVTNLENGRKVRVRVNDRGPFVDGRIIDLSPAAADRLGFRAQGVARVRVKLLGPASTADAGQIQLAAIRDLGADLY
jgi:rare lipoprotein A